MAATRQELEMGLFGDPTFEEKTLRFASDAGCQVVYITKERYLDVDEDGERSWLPSFPSFHPFSPYPSPITSL